MRRTASLVLALLLATPASAATRGDDVAVKQVDAFLAAYDHAHSFRGRIEVRTEVKGKVKHAKYLLALEKPRKTAMTVLENPSLHAAEGTKIVWFGEPTVTVKTSFFGMPVKLHPRYDDSRLCGPRGDTMSDLSVVTAVAMTRDPATRFKFVKTDLLNGRPAHVIEVRSPKLLHDIDHELLWLDDQLHLPFRRDMVTADGTVAYHLTVETFDVDGKLPADAFTVD